MDSGAEGEAALWGCILPKYLDLQQNIPVRISGCWPSHALLSVARTCLQTPLVPEAEVWDGQAGGASQEWDWQRSLVPSIGQLHARGGLFTDFLNFFFL